MTDPAESMRAIKDRLANLRPSGSSRGVGSIVPPSPASASPVSSMVSVSRGRKKKQEPPRAVLPPSFTTPTVVAAPPPVQINTPDPPTFADFRAQLFQERYLGGTITERTEDEL